MIRAGINPEIAAELGCTGWPAAFIAARKPQTPTMNPQIDARAKKTRRRIARALR
jgi:hypothetical protein